MRTFATILLAGLGGIAVLVLAGRTVGWGGEEVVETFREARGDQKMRAQGDTLRVTEVTPVDSVWSALPVGFSLLTHEDSQFVAYYDHRRMLTVAARRLGSDRWTRVQLEERVPWDSHNYITMAVDERGHLHLSGNMHVDSLNYYRTTRPLDVTSFEQVGEMVGRDEGRCTYPTFLRGPEGRLIFGYRSGESGEGKRIYNVYHADDRRWRRLLDTPLLDGSRQDMNAYPLGPKRGPEGVFHLVWMWRNTPDARTNHDISYMRSRDLQHWESADGRPVALPVTPGDTGVVVDPVPSKAGLINMGFALGFDRRNRPIVSYHKYDEHGHSQIYNARWEGTWTRYQTSDWTVRWNFGGGGSIPSRVGAGAVRPAKDGALLQPYWHWKKGEGAWRLDAETLRPIGRATAGPLRPARVTRVRSTFPSMHVRWESDAGTAEEAGTRYQLRWETLGRNRDRPREGELPPPSTLEVYTFAEPEE